MDLSIATNTYQYKEMSMETPNKDLSDEATVPLTLENMETTFRLVEAGMCLWI